MSNWQRDGDDKQDVERRRESTPDHPAEDAHPHRYCSRCDFYTDHVSTAHDGLAQRGLLLPDPRVPAKDARDVQLDANCTGGHDREAILSQARLSEGKVERLAEALWRNDIDEPTRRESSLTWEGQATPTNGDAYREAFRRQAQRLLADPVVADMLTQREREVVARVEAAIASMPEYANWTYIGRYTNTIRRALGGTADGQGA